jgi:asparagine synthase (glutamine-hydrolysing)
MGRIGGIVHMKEAPEAASADHLQQMMQAMNQSGQLSWSITSWNSGTGAQGTFHQPLTSSTSSYSNEVLAFFDGTIYNKAIIAGRLDLPADCTSGQLFTHLYQTHQTNRLEELEGRWACAVVDPKQNRFWLSRDRTGVKPLYYLRHPEYLVFASELKALAAFPSHQLRSNPGVVFDYFIRNVAESGEETLFQDCFQVLPGESLFFEGNSNTFHRERYFSLPKPPPLSRLDADQAISYQHQIRSLVDQGINRRFESVSSDHTGAFLSGGLDSSVIALALHTSTGVQLPYFTAAYKQKDIGEQHWAKIVLERVKGQENRVFPSAEGLRQDLEDFIYSQDTPTFSSGTYAQYCLFKAASEAGCRYVFDGQGADALFGGHKFYYPFLWRELLKLGDIGRLTTEIRSFGGWGSSINYYLRNWMKYSIVPGFPVSWQWFSKKRYFAEWKYLNPDFLEQYKYRLGKDRPTPIGNLNQILQQGYYGFGMRFLLKCVDRAAARFGLETLTPFADDPALSDFLFQIPGSYKIVGQHRKYLLKEAYADLLPEAIYKRTDKKGLQTPNNEWVTHLQHGLLPYLESLDESIFNKQLIIKEADDFFNLGPSLENYRVYKYLSFAVWSYVYDV